MRRWTFLSLKPLLVVVNADAFRAEPGIRSPALDRMILAESCAYEALAATS